MQEKEIESQITKIFDKNSHLFQEQISKSDFRFKEVLKFLNGAFDKKVLDLGCGNGRFCRKLKESGFLNIVGVEPSGELINLAKKNNKDIEFIQASAVNLPFLDKEFDFLICIEVLEHVPDTEKALKEMARVLKPGGRLLIIDKNIFSLHPIYFIPTILWKEFLEGKNKWLYPKGFLFKEKYFNPWKLRGLLKKHFSKVELRFIRYEHINKNHSLFLKFILGTHNVISIIFYKIFPFLNFFAAFEGEI